MPSTKIHRRGAATRAAATRDHELIQRAAKQADWAGAVLKRAAGDLNDAHGEDGNALTGLAELVLEHAGRVSNLAEDIDSHRIPS
jgi:hypothetical protein